MAADEEEQPSPLQYPPPTFTSGDDESITPVEEEVCPKCGTVDCISQEEYQSRLTGSSYGSVNLNHIMQTCSHRCTINKMKELEKENPGIWGRKIKELHYTGSTGPK